jgi:arylsulfatase A-like enzyme
MEVRLVRPPGRCRALVVVVLAAAGLACAPSPPRTRAPSNLLLITLDTLRADHLGCYGYPRPTSPVLDRFAATAARFEDVTCSVPTTLPSHLTIFTGLPPQRHGVTRNGQVRESYPPSIFDRLRAAGARTAAIVSAGVVEAHFVQLLGFEEVVFDRPDAKVFQVGAEVVSDNALRWLERHRGGRFALWLHYYDPHEPYDPPGDVAARFTGGYDGELPDALSTDWLVGLNRPAADAALSAADRQHVIDLYDAEVAFLDAQVGRVLAALSELGLDGTTLVAIVADHGQAHGESSFWGHGERLLEPVIKVPLLVHLPGQREGRVVSAAVETLDLVPTLLECFGLEPIAGLPGRSLVGALRGEGIDPAGWRLVERRSYPEAPERAGLVVHRVTEKGTYYREPEGETFHIGRLGGNGGLDGQDFFEPDGEASAWLSARVEQYIAALAAVAAGTSPEDLEMLHALGYVR